MRTKLSESEIQSKLSAGWEFRDNMIHRVFEFPSYAHGALFAGAVGLLAEGMDHHPDILVQWRKVTVSLNTHDAGGVSDTDFALAEKIDRLREQGPA